MAFPSLKKSTTPTAALPPGVYQAFIRAVVAAGTQVISQERGPIVAIVIEFSVPGEFGPTSIHRRYPYSIGVFVDPATGERRPSALRALLESVLPAEMEAFDADDLAEDFRIDQLLGQPVSITIEVKDGSNGGGTFSNIVKVEGAPDRADSAKAAMAAAGIETVLFDGQDRIAFRMLPPEIQAICRKGGIAL